MRQPRRASERHVAQGGAPSQFGPRAAGHCVGNVAVERDRAKPPADWPGLNQDIRQVGSMPTQNWTRPWVLLWAATATFSLWMRAGLPIHVIEDAPYDDGLFIKLAKSISDGRWLGTYDNATLVKGAFYSIFVAATHMAYVPIKIAEQAVFIGASFIVSIVLSARVRHGRVFGTLLFVFLCANPVLWYEDFGRIIRDGLYVGLGLAVTGLTAMAAFPRRSRSSVSSLVIGLSLGLVAGAFWTTREEGVILLPTVLVIAGAGFIQQAWHMPAGLRSLSIRWPWGMAVSSCAAALGFAAVLVIISALNFHYYGVFATVEVKQAPFIRAYGALARIKPTHWQRYVVFPEDVRKRAYAVSPAARELASVFEGPYGQEWAHKYCTEAGIDPCTGVHAGWFQWVFREAVAHAGHYTLASEASKYYKRLAEEINAACADGRLDCLPPRATLVPPFQWQYIGDTWAKAKLIFRLLLFMGSDERHIQHGVASRGYMDSIADVIGPSIPLGTPHFEAHGWVGAYQSRPLIQLRSHGFMHFDTSLDLEAAPDVELIYPGLQAVRFVIDTDCAPAECDLVLGWPDKPEITVPLTAFAKNSMPLHDVVKVQIDDVSETPSFPLTGNLRAFQGRIARGVARFYAIACRFLLVPACAGLILAAVFRRRAYVPLIVYALAGGCGLAVISRVVLLAFLDVTSIPFNVPYLVIASPFLIVFVALGLYAGVSTVLGIIRSRSDTLRPTEGGFLILPASLSDG